MSEQKQRAQGADALDQLSFALHGRKATPQDFIGGSDANILADAAKRVAALTAERDALKATVERLSAPVSDAELAPYVLLIEDGEGHKGWFIDPEQVGVIIAARTNPPAKP